MFKYIQEKVKPFTWITSGTSIQISTAGSWLLRQPPAIRMDYGLPNKLVGEYIHGYGNAIVPQIAYSIFRSIEEYEKMNT
jgi:hypothetical protein